MKKTVSVITLLCFLATCLPGNYPAYAQAVSLPVPGAMVNLSPAYEPVIIKGLTIHKDNPFLFDFIVDIGQDKLSGEPLKKEGEKLIKYFLASLAIPDTDVWVNLSPYEKNRMIPEALGQTDMGRDLLQQDYILKQITASLIYPEKDLGKKFWDRVYSKARQMFGTTQIPVNTFNKVWIMADRAEVFEHNQTAFVVDQHLKVMLEEDYLALQKHNKNLPFLNTSGGNPDTTHSITSSIIKQIILPELEKEINTGKNFANLRQIFNSIILSSWYKKNLKAALLNQIYANQSKVKGIGRVIASEAKQSQQNLSPVQIYQQYLKAYKKGVFNYIKEDINTASGLAFPRKYFSGGINEAMAANPTITYDASAFAGSLSDRAMVDMHTGFSPSFLHESPANRIDAAMSPRRRFLFQTVAIVVGVPVSIILKDLYKVFSTTSYGKLVQKQIIKGSSEWDEVQGYIHQALEDPIINSIPKYREAVKAFQSAAENGLFDILKGAGGVASPHIKDHKYLYSTVGLDLELMRHQFKKAQDNRLYKLMAFDVFIKEGRTVIDQQNRPDFYVKWDEQNFTAVLLPAEELKDFIARTVAGEAVGYRIFADYLNDNHVSPQELQDLRLKDRDLLMDSILMQGILLLGSINVTVPAHKDREEEIKEQYLKAMVFALIAMYSRTMNKEVFDRFKKDITREYGEDALDRIARAEQFQDYSVLKPLLFLNDQPYRLPPDHAMSSKKRKDVTAYAATTERKIVKGSAQWDVVQGYINQALEDPFIKSTPKYYEAVKAFQRASENGLYDILTGSGGYASPVFKNHRYLYSTVGLDLRYMRNLFNKFNEGQIYKLLAFGTLIKEGRTVLDYENRPDFYVQWAEMDDHNVFTLNGAKLKDYIARIIAGEAVGYRSLIDYLIDHDISPQILDQLRLQQRSSDPGIGLSENKGLMIAMTIPVVQKELEAEVRELYFKIMIFILMTETKTLHKAIYERFRKDIEAEFGKGALLKIAQLEHFQDYTVTRPLMFLNDPPYRLPPDQAMGWGEFFHHHVPVVTETATAWADGEILVSVTREGKHVKVEFVWENQTKVIKNGEWSEQGDVNRIASEIANRVENEIYISKDKGITADEFRRLIGNVSVDGAMSARSLRMIAALALLLSGHYITEHQDYLGAKIEEMQSRNPSNPNAPFGFVDDENDKKGNLTSRKYVVKDDLRIFAKDRTTLDMAILKLLAKKGVVQAAEQLKNLKESPLPLNKTDQKLVDAIEFGNAIVEIKHDHDFYIITIKIGKVSPYMANNREAFPGGIDLNTSNGMQWKVSKDGKGVEMNIDPMLIDRIKRQGLDSLSPIIFKVTPIANIWLLIGLQTPAKILRNS
jgi:hypothetical protein